MHLIAILLLLYFLPLVVALLRRAHHTGLILLLNLFAGWTVVGWMAAMLWALLSGPKYVYVYPSAQGYRRY